MRAGVLGTGRIFTERSEHVGYRERPLFVTLTTRPGVLYSPRLITEYVDRCQSWARARKFDLRGVWRLERGAGGMLHYHAVWWIPARYLMPRADARGWWRHGSTNTQPVKRSAIGYLAKYMGKPSAGRYVALPRAARIWGAIGLAAPERRLLCWRGAPGWLRELVPAEDGVRREPGGWWVNAATGWGYRSPWDYDWSTGQCTWRGWCWDDVRLPGGSEAVATAV